MPDIQKLNLSLNQTYGSKKNRVGKSSGDGEQKTELG